MKIGEFLKSKRKEKGYSLRRLAIKIGISHSTIADVERGSIHKKETIEKIAEGLLMTKQEREEAFELLAYERLPEDLKKEIMNYRNKKFDSGNDGASTVIEIPVYGAASAGGGSINMSNVVRYEKIIVLAGEDLPKGVFGVEVSGDSMSPTLLDGDLAIIDPQCEDINLKNEVCIVTYDGCEYVKRITYNEKFVTLMSDNPDRQSYPDIIVLKDEHTDFRCHGVAIEVRRKLRRR